MYREHKSSLIEEWNVDCRNAIGVRRRSHRRARETAARHTVELSMNTPTGTPADPRTDQGSNADTTTSEVVVAAAGTAVAVTEGRAGGSVPRRQRSRLSLEQLLREPSTSRRPGGASTQPAGERSFMTAPLSLDTIDSPPTPKPPTTGDAPEGAPPPRPIEHGGQTVTRSRSYQYASTGSTLSTNITTSRS